MCGINGIVGFNSSVEYQHIENLNTGLTHRGPDAQGTFVSKRHNVGLGHTRLSIVDLSDSANQPFSDQTYRYWLSFNGEIYNFAEIKKQLVALGYQFRTHCDTEVVLCAYIQWGADCQKMFNGMWAFAIWDEAKAELFLSKDRFGVKPLYFTINSQRFIFASEQKAFTQLDRRYGIINAKIAASVITNPSLIESQRKCIYEDIQRLRAGECATVDLKGNLEIRRWWHSYDEICNLSDVSEAEAIELFSSACELRTRTDVPICTSLSGGLDSSAVTSCLAMLPQAIERKLCSFTVSFPDSQQDEYKWAKMLAEQVHIDNHKIEVTERDFFEGLMPAVFAVEDLIGQPPIAQWQLYKGIHNCGYKVSIEGHGGDELLGGYPSHVRAFIGERLLQHDHLPQLAHAIVMLKQVNQHFSPHLRDLQGMILQSTNDQYTVVDKSQGLLGRYFGESQTMELDFDLLSRNADFNNESLLFKKLYFDFHYLTQPNILRNYDKLSMANSVEVRAPMLDYRFAMACFKLLPSSKIWDGDNKRLLRNYLYKKHPQISTRRDKLGFTAPLQQWMEKGMAAWCETLSYESSFLESTLFDGKAASKTIKRLVLEKDHTRLASFWPLLNLHILSQKAI